MNRLAVVLAGLCVSLPVIAGESAVTTRPAPVHAAGVQSITSNQLRAWIRFLSSDELAGREAGELGYDVAALYCRSVFESLGLEPAGDVMADGRDYFQRFVVVHTRFDEKASSISVRRGEKKRDFPFRGRVGGPVRASVEWRGAVVVATPPDRGQEAADALDGAIALLIGSADRDAPEVETAWLREAGCRRALVASPHLTRRYSRGRVRSVEADRVGSESDEGEKGARVETLYISDEVANELLAGTGLTTKALRARETPLESRALDGVEVEVTLRVTEVDETRTHNVLARVPGADPEIGDEHVVIGAHLDHVGQHDGKIFNGADDDASGCAGVLALGRAFRQNPARPRRSVLLALWGAEEKGLIGSRYFVDNPTVPIESIVAKLNMDMIGRDEEHGDKEPDDKESADENRNSVHLVGSRRHSLELHSIIETLNESVGLDLEDDQEDVYGRSDQFHFGRVGIPVAFFFAGFHRDYHKETDTIEKLNFEKMTRIVQLVYMTAHSLADHEGRLRRVQRF